MNTTKRTLTLYPATYEIQVPGHLDPGWLECPGPLEVRVEGGASGTAVTILHGTLDQAALHGLLRRIYTLGLPLISVTWLADE